MPRLEVIYKRVPLYVLILKNQEEDLKKACEVTGKSKTDAISRTLGAIKEALEMTGVPGIVTSQLSREHERGSGSNRKPGLIDLRACGEIEEKSNAVAFLWPRCKYEHDYTGTDVDFYFRKPYGKEAEWTLFFDQDCLKHYMPICELGQGDFIL